MKFHAPDLYFYAKVDLHETVINSHYLAFDRPRMQLLYSSSAWSKPPFSCPSQIESLNMRWVGLLIDMQIQDQEKHSEAWGYLFILRPCLVWASTTETGNGWPKTRERIMDNHHFLLFADFPVFSFMPFKKLFSNSYSDGMAALGSERFKMWNLAICYGFMCKKYAASKLKIPWCLFSYFFVCLQMAKRSSWSSILTPPCLFWQSVSPAWTQGPTGPWHFSNRERWKRRKQEGETADLNRKWAEGERGKRK